MSHQWTKTKVDKVQIDDISRQHLTHLFGLEVVI